MAKRTAARIVTEYMNKQRTPEYIRALAVAIGRQDVLDLLRNLREGTVATAWVVCKKCNVLVPFGDEKFRAGKHYCVACYRKEFTRAKAIDEEDEVPASSAESTELQEVPEPVDQAAEDAPVPAPRGEDDPDSGSGTSDQDNGSSVDAVSEAVPETPRRMKWW